MKWKKIDIEKRVNIWIRKLKNPNLSLRDIAKEENVWHSTVKKVLQEDLIQVSTTELWKQLYDYNLEIINEWAAKVAIAIKTLDAEDLRDAKDIQSIVDTAFKQNQLLLGKPTSNIRIEDLSSLTNKELEEARNQFL